MSLYSLISYSDHEETVCVERDAQRCEIIYLCPYAHTPVSYSDHEDTVCIERNASKCKILYLCQFEHRQCREKQVKVREHEFTDADVNKKKIGQNENREKQFKVRIRVSTNVDNVRLTTSDWRTASRLDCVN